MENLFFLYVRHVFANKSPNQHWITYSGWRGWYDDGSTWVTISHYVKILHENAIKIVKVRELPNTQHSKEVIKKKKECVIFMIEAIPMEIDLNFMQIFCYFHFFTSVQ
jgi:hypothetical protein